jgi:hypothetical protein
MVGVNVNVDPGAPTPVPPGTPRLPPGEKRLRRIRLADPLERLAAQFAAVMAGEAATVIRVGKGGDPDLADALAAVGIRASDGVGAAAEGVTAAPRLACIVVGEDGAAASAEAAARLRAAGARAIVAATTAPGAPPAWCDGIVTPDCDLVVVFSGLLDRIADRQEKRQG